MKENMEIITIYPENEKQKSLLKLLLEEMKIRFELIGEKELSEYSKEDYFEKIDKSIHQAAQGKTKRLTKDQQKSFLGL